MIIACVVITACIEQNKSLQVHDSPKLLVLLNTYSEQLQKLQLALYADVKRQALKTQSDELHITAQTMLAVFADQKSQCVDYISQLLLISNELQINPLKQRSDEYIQSLLPQFELPICYHLKDLLIQPIILLSLASNFGEQQSNYYIAQVEIAELMAHLQLVKKSLINEEDAHLTYSY